MEHRRILVDTSLFIEYFRKKNKEKTKLSRIKKKEYSHRIQGHLDSIGSNI